MPLKYARLSDVSYVLYVSNVSYVFFVSNVSYFFFVSDFNMSMYSEVRCDGWIDCGRMYPISM